MARQPSSPSARSFFSSVGSSRIGVGSIFQSPVCSTLPSGVRMISAFASGIECATVTSSTSNGPTVKRPPTGTTFTSISAAILLARALGLDHRRGEGRRIDRHLQLRPQFEQRAEMVLVRVGDDDAAEVLPLRLEKPDVGQDQVDARQMLLRRERHADIDGEPLAPVLGPQPVNRQVHADLADAAERREYEFLLSRAPSTLLQAKNLAGRHGRAAARTGQQQPARLIQSLKNSR